MNRDDVINKVFPHSLFGYDPVAVDAFLDEVIREFDRMNNTIDVLQLKLSHELSEARQTNDLLAVRLAHADFVSRAEQLRAAEPNELTAGASKPEEANLEQDAEPSNDHASEHSSNRSTERKRKKNRKNSKKQKAPQEHDLRRCYIPILLIRISSIRIFP